MFRVVLGLLTLRQPWKPKGLMLHPSMPFYIKVYAPKPQPLNIGEGGEFSRVLRP